MTPKRASQLGISATTFLLLCCYFGFHATVDWLLFIAIVGVWLWACGRYRLVYVATLGFFEGLFNIRSGYYYGPYHGSQRRPTRYRRFRVRE